MSDYKPTYANCKKCGTIISKAIIDRMDVKRCPYCHEPSLEFFDMAAADWSTPAIEQGETTKT